jgi:hypothetical protein
MGATQWRTSIEGVTTTNPGGQSVTQIRTIYLGFDHNALFSHADRMEIPSGPSFIARLRVFEDEVLRRIRTKSAGTENRCDEAKRQRCTFEYGEYLDWMCTQCKKGNDR